MAQLKALFYYLILSFILLAPSDSLMAWDGFERFDIGVEARVAYFKPTSKRLRHIYGNGWADYQLQFSKRISCDWKMWVGVSGFSMDGDSSGYYRRHNRLQLIPINLGLKYYFPFCEEFKFHIGGAICYSYMSVKENSEYFDIHRHKSGWGGLIQAGVDYNFWESAYVGFFVDGYFQEFNFHNPAYTSLPSGDSTSSNQTDKISIDVSALKIGFGIGYNF